MTNGVLASPHRLRAVLPFAVPALMATGLLGIDRTVAVWALPVMASATVVALAITFAVPWGRVPRWMQTLPAQTYVVGVALLLSADRGAGQAYLPLIGLPLLWLAIYESNRALRTGLAITAGGELLDLVWHHLAAPRELLHAGVVVAVAAAAVPAVHRLVDAVRLQVAQLHALVELKGELIAGAPIEDAIRRCASVVSGADDAWLAVAAQPSLLAVDVRGADRSVRGPTVELSDGHVAVVVLGFRRRPRRLTAMTSEIVGLMAAAAGTTTLLRRRDEELAASEARFRALADSAADVVYRMDLSDAPRFEYVSPSIEVVTGFPVAAFMASDARALDVVHPADRWMFERGAAAAPNVADVRWIRADGAQVVLEHHITAVPGEAAVYGIARDVTELHRLQAELADRAHHDALTGLANRLLLEELVGPVIDRAGGRGSSVSVAFIDLDGFKQVNDTFGHRGGDAVLVEVADRLRGAVRTADVVARVGGDEFVIVLDRPALDLAAFVERLVASIERPIRLEGGAEVVVGASVGVADLAPDRRDLTAIIAAADAAMYREKSARKAALAGRDHPTSAAAVPFDAGDRLAS